MSAHGRRGVRGYAPPAWGGAAVLGAPTPWKEGEVAHDSPTAYARNPPAPGRWPATLLLTSASLLAPALAGPPSPLPGSGRLTVVERVLTQDQGDWQVDYCLKLEGSKPLVLAPAELGARVEGWLSNSRVAVHATPRRSECVIAGQGGPMAAADVISSTEESLRCRERAVIRVTLGRQEPATRPQPEGGDPEATPHHRHRRARRPAPRPAPPRTPALLVRGL